MKLKKLGRSPICFDSELYLDIKTKLNLSIVRP